MAALDSDKVRSALREKMGCEEERSGDHVRYILRDGNLSWSKARHRRHAEREDGTAIQVGNQCKFRRHGAVHEKCIGVPRNHS